MGLGFYPNPLTLSQDEVQTKQKLNVITAITSWFWEVITLRQAAAYLQEKRVLNISLYFPAYPKDSFALMSQGNAFRVCIVRNCMHLCRYGWYLISPSASGIPQKTAWTHQSSWLELLHFNAPLKWYVWSDTESVLTHVIGYWSLTDASHS